MLNGEWKAEENDPFVADFFEMQTDRSEGGAEFVERMLHVAEASYDTAQTSLNRRWMGAR